MKKIKLNSSKLILKKSIIGNLTSSEMKNILGGEETGQSGCQNLTEEYCQSNDPMLFTLCATQGCESNATACYEDHTTAPLSITNYGGGPCTITFSMTCPGNIC